MKQILFLALIFLVGCKSHQEVLYLQEAGEQVTLTEGEVAKLPEAVIREGDLLVITVNTNTPEMAMPFNLPLIPGTTSSNYTVKGTINTVSSGGSLQNYLVDTEGKLIFPVIGELQVAGLTKSQLVQLLKEKIYPQYLNEEPIILVRFGNFRVSVMGEVARPGTFNIENERVTVLEALSMAGDMTIYGNRAGILLVRETNGLREAVRLNIRDKNLIHSPYFYLQQNDVLYVEPNAPRQRASNISAAETLSISIVGTLISLTTLLINILK